MPKKNNCKNVSFFTGNLFNIPLPDNSMDVVYTSHSIEPNGGKEKVALEGLYRVTSKYTVLLEPSYHFGSEEAKKRMLRNGYITKLHEEAIGLGYNVIEYRLFDHSANPLNPPELIIIEKDVSTTEIINFCCPITGAKLNINDNTCYPNDGFFVYPVISQIPCLLSDNAIIATKYSEFIN